MAVLTISDLIKKYRSPDGEVKTVLDIPNFDLEAGKQLALDGPSGTGKTTLLHIIAGILKPDSGSVKIGDACITELAEAARDRVRADLIGYVFQTFNLLQAYSALENILLAMSFGSGGSVEEASSLLNRVGLGDRIHYRPSQLSVGQQQRVALARALCSKPKLVLADEPTGNLDPVMAQQSLELLREICQENGAALLCVSHDQAILSQFEHRKSLVDINRAVKTSDKGHPKKHTGTAPEANETTETPGDTSETKASSEATK